MATPEPTRDTETEITRVLGLVALLRPDLIEQFSYAEQRRTAANMLARRREKRVSDVPAAFLDAFAGDDR